MKETELTEKSDAENSDLRDASENNKDNSKNFGVKDFSIKSYLFKNYYFVFYLLILIFGIYVYFIPFEMEFVLDGVNSIDLGIFILNIISRVSAKWLGVLSLFGLVFSFFKGYFKDIIFWYTIFILIVTIGSIISLIM